MAPRLGKERSQRTQRLSLACNQCRRRKVRCDARMPRCNNCCIRGENCDTSNLRKPGGPTTRTRAVSRSFASQHAWNDASPTMPTTDAGAGMQERTPPSPADRTCNPVVAERSESSVDQPTTQSQPPAYGAERSIQSITDSVVLVDGDPSRVKFVGGSSNQALCSFLDLYLVKQHIAPLSSLFKHGMKVSEEIALPTLVPTIPSLPDPCVLSDLLDTYFSRIWPLYPVVDRTELEADIHRIEQLFHSHGSDLLGTLPASEAPILASVYALISLSLDEINASASSASYRYLLAAYSLQASVVAVPYLKSAQALVLLALALRARMKHGQAWHIIGHATRLAQSLGLHKDMQMLHESRAATRMELSHRSPLRVRVWGCIYAFEKLQQLESGRPSMIPDVPAFDTLPDTYADCFSAWVYLAAIMGRISESIYNRTAQTPQELLYHMGTLDLALVDWERRVPVDLKPHQNSPSVVLWEVDPQKVILNILWIEFGFVQIVLLRIALLFPQQIYRTEVLKHGVTLPSSGRVLLGASICAHQARRIVTDVLQLADVGIYPTHTGSIRAFLAALVLALLVLRSPQSLMTRPDLELLCSAIEHVENLYDRWGLHRSYARIATEFRERVCEAYRRAETKHGQRSALPSQGSQATTPRTDQTETAPDVAASAGAAPAEAVPARAAPAPSAHTPSSGDHHHSAHVECDDARYRDMHHDIPTDPDSGAVPFGDLNFDEFWTMFESGAWHA